MTSGGPGRESSTTRIKNLWTAAIAVLAVAVATLEAAAIFSTPEPPSASLPALSPSSTTGSSAAPVVSLWIGDSYTAGAGAKDAEHAESCLTAARMGWLCDLDAEGGTGFVADGHDKSLAFAPVGQRLEATAENSQADVVIIDTGRTDPDDQTTVDAARTFFDDVRSAYPKAAVVLVAPYYMTSDSAIRPTLAAFEQKYAQGHGSFHFVDPIAEGWISLAKSGSMVLPDKVHPGPAGHRYVAEHLAVELRRFRDLPLVES